MPGVYGDGSMGAAFRQVLQRLRALETQQQSVISDNLGRPVITDGMVPGSNPPLYGRMVWDPNTNTRLMFQGYDSGSDTAYVAFYDSTGNVVNKFDQAGQHVYKVGVEVVNLDQDGLHVYDASSNNRVNAGELSNGDYGLQVIDVDGNSEEVLPTVASFYNGSFLSTSSSSYVHLSGSPSVTLVVGASGRAQVWIGAAIQASSSGLASVSVLIGGSNPASAPSADWPFANEGTQYAAGIISGLTPGSTTFDFGCSSASGTANFTDMALIVQPL